MVALLPLILGSLKSLLLLVVAGGMTLALRGRPARLRAVVWATALAGSLLIPMVTPLVPTWSLPLPVSLVGITADDAPRPLAAPQTGGPPISVTGNMAEGSHFVAVEPTASSQPVNWQPWLIAFWALGAAAALSRLGFGLWRVAGILRRARPVTDPQWLAHLHHARAQVGCRRRVRLVISAEVEIPATVGIARPTILLPLHAHTWPRERRWAVLLHEVVHVARIDWGLRMTARVARAAYWFNPIAWWAVRRLDFETELACDEEVLALGTRASSYARHLLGIARSVARCPAPAITGLEMARMTHLEERIMSILKGTTHRKAGLTVLLPAAVLVAAMVPALAAVYPEDPGPRPASPELKQIMTEMRAAEARLEPHLERIESLEIELEPRIEMIEDIEIDIDFEAIAEIEERMQPFIEQMAAIEIDMAPFEAKMEELEEKLENLVVHIEDGTLEEVQRQIHEQMERHMEGFESIHIEMEPFLEQIEAIHKQMEPLHREIAAIHIQVEPMHEQLEKLHIELGPFHQQMETLHEGMEPIHEELERLSTRLEHALQSDITSTLRAHLGGVVAPDAPIDEAAARVIEDANIRVTDDLLRVDTSFREVREILGDLLGAHRVGTQEAFDRAVDAAAAALSPLEIQVD